MTANAFSDDIDETLGAGMNVHFSKPIEPEVLFRTIGEQLQVKFAPF